MNKLIITAILSIFLFTTSGCNATLVDNVEKFLYGYTYPSQSDTIRLNRIEETIYGKKTNQTDSQKLARIKKDLSADLIGQEIAPKEDTFMTDSDYEKTVDDEPIPQGSNIDYPIINQMENKLFNKEFKTNDVNGRLARLEQKEFGKTYNDDLNTRVERLQSKISPRTYNTADNDIANSLDNYNDYNDTQDGIKAPSNYNLSQYGSPDIDYDAYNSRNYKSPSQYRSNASGDFKLSAIEKAMFKTTYDNDNIENRLSRIESGLFGTVFDSDTKEERMDRISSAINAQKSAKHYDSNKFGQNMSTAIQIGAIILMVLSCIL